MKLGWNLLAGLANSAWTAIVSLAVVPFYLRYLGVEAYGLIGFFTAMQAVFGLLDMGLSPTINREVARSLTEQEQAQSRNLLHSLATVYWAVGVVIAAAIAAAAPYVAHDWLRSANLSAQALSHSLMLMGLVVGCRLPLGLYLGALMGTQRMVAASAIEIAMSTLSSVGALAVLALVSPTTQAFFAWQVLVALLNVGVVRAYAWKALGRERGARSPRFDGAALRTVWRFSAGMAVTALLGTVYLQGDKILLSRLVTLQELGRYTLAGVAARSLYVLLTPTFGAIYPRLSTLHAAGDADELIALYRSGTRLLMAAVWPLGIFVTMFATELFELWTGNIQLSASLGPVVGFLLLGTAFNGAMHFPYALQLAYGRSDLAARINTYLLAVYVPVLAMLVWRFGIVGAAAAWAVYNGLYLCVGAWLTHRVILRGVGRRWLLGDVGLPLVVSVFMVAAGGLCIRALPIDPYSRLLFGGLLTLAAFSLVIAISPELRGGVRRIVSSNTTVLGRQV